MFDLIVRLLFPDLFVDLTVFEDRVREPVFVLTLEELFEERFRFVTPVERVLPVVVEVIPFD
ncbi:MAG: hypothetical protein ACPGGA_08545 [Balneolaceae bacterium]